MARKQYLIAYDISDDKRRANVFKTLVGQGDHVQYSVFLCALSPSEQIALRAKLDELIHAREDQVMIVDLGTAASASPLIECLGKRYNPSIRVQVF